MMKHLKSKMIVAALLAACAVTGAKESKLPAGLKGDWFEGNISPTTYWDRQTGVYSGSARQMGSVLKLHDDGTYEKYVYIFMKSYNVESEVWTSYKGVASFDGKTMTLTPTSGHYKSRMGSKLTDRDMTDEDLKKGKSTYNWLLEKRDNRSYLILPFDDGSKFEYRRLDKDK